MNVRAFRTSTYSGRSTDTRPFVIRFGILHPLFTTQDRTLLHPNYQNSGQAPHKIDYKTLKGSTRLVNT